MIPERLHLVLWQGGDPYVTTYPPWPISREGNETKSRHAVGKPEQYLWGTLEEGLVLRCIVKPRPTYSRGSKWTLLASSQQFLPDDSRRLSEEQNPWLLFSEKFVGSKSLHSRRFIAFSSCCGLYNGNIGDGPDENVRPAYTGERKSMISFPFSQKFWYTEKPTPEVGFFHFFSAHSILRSPETVHSGGKWFCWRLGLPELYFGMVL
jgi:hypothetical protein